MNQQLKIYFAPFQGITTSTFRRVYADYFKGVDKLFTPYYSKIIVGEKLPSKILASLKNQVENGIEVVPQILSNNASEILSFAKNCQQLGFKELNWNLGCPHPQVADRKKGSGLLPHPKIINEILQKVSAEIGINFSVKTRLGFYSSAELEALIPIFNRHPISELIIHARTGKQMYSGKADLEIFSHNANQSKAQLVYNGDIQTIEDYENFCLRFPEIPRLMLGRGILTDPFLPARMKGIALPVNPKAHLQKFMEELYLAYRKDKNDQLTLLNLLKEYWRYLANLFNEPIKVLRHLKKTKSFDAYEEAVAIIFKEFELIR